MGVKLGLFTLREEHRLKVFENMVLMRIFEPKWGKILGGWRKWHNKELRNLYLPSRIIQTERIRLAGYVARMGRTADSRLY
jgi:hypothetical protein